MVSETHPAIEGRARLHWRFANMHNVTEETARACALAFAIALHANAAEPGLTLKCYFGVRPIREVAP